MPRPPVLYGADGSLSRIETKAAVSVTTAATQLETTQKNISGVLLQADPLNSDSIAIGDSSVVATLSAVQGFEMLPGKDLILTIKDARAVYHRARSGTQKLFVTYLHA